jgi:CRISPR/Cas system-associated endoribonuclease Cas2
MRNLLKRFLEKLVVWMQRKMYEDTISEKEAKRMLREIKKMMEENKVKK